MRRLGLQSLPMAFAVWLSAFPPAQAQTQAQSQVQDWPARPVRIIIPLGAGGGGDVFARLLYGFRVSILFGLALTITSRRRWRGYIASQ